MTTIAVRQTPDAQNAPGTASLHQAILAGLSQPQKFLPCSYIYDARGSALFEAITEQPEYYPTRVETAILASCAQEIAVRTPPGSILVELGSGSSRKTELLLDAIPNLSAYAPIDVSQSALDAACARLGARYPALRLLPTVGDFTDLPDLPAALAKRPRLGFFPGSTIGNFRPADACGLLRTLARTLGPEARLVIGVDLAKDHNRLVAAYNDAAGVTAEFNRNLLVRANRELGARFDVTKFAHSAIYNATKQRIEMYLVSLDDQTVEITGAHIRFTKGERIHTENSYKYTVAQFAALAIGAGWHPSRAWTDAENLFSVHELGQSPARSQR
jgi:dimethylhistidine N-methyltransferase